MADIINGSEAKNDCLTLDQKMQMNKNLDDKHEKEFTGNVVAKKGKDVNSNNELASDDINSQIDNKLSGGMDVKKNELNKSLNLRFGIEAILKVKAEVTDKLCEKNAESDTKYRQTELITTDQGEIDNDLEGDISADSEDDGIDQVDENDDVRGACLSHVRLPASFQGLRPDDNSYFTSQNLFSSGRINLDLPWSPAILNDLRKDRFGPIRRIGHPYQNRTPPKRKKPRTSFTRLQILELEKRFERQKYLASSERSSLAKTLKMSDAQVKTWFQNRRTKWRRQTAEERELERQAANRLLLSFQSDPVHRKSMVISTDRMCLSQLQRFQEERSTDI